MVTIGDNFMKSVLRVLWRGLLVILCGVFLGVFIFAGYQLYNTFYGYHAATQEYENLNQQFVSTQVTPEASPEATPEPTEAVIELTPEVVAGPISVDFNSLLAQNSQVVGWIYSPNTVISYPVLKGGDNDYYLHHTLTGAENASGSIFMDAVCEPDLSGDNTILYGHNMRDGSMFALIDDYIDPAFCEAHPFFYLNTPTQNYRVDIFAGFTTDPESFVYTTAFGEESDFAAYLNTLRSLSDFSVPTELSSSDRILTLSTCTYSDLDVRYVLFGRLAEIG